MIMLAGCSAPHDNPLDPKSDFYRAPMDTTRPVVTATVPVNEATGEPIGTNIIAIFSEGMDTSTLTIATFVLQQEETPISGTVSYTGMTAIFNPDSELVMNTLYTATITAGAKDLADNAIVTEYIWHFTTQQDTSVPRPILIPSVHSEHVSRIFPTQDTYSVIAEMIAIGPPFVDSAWVRYRTGSPVVMEERNGTWTSRFSSTVFNDYTLGSVIGQPFFFSALDHSGNTTEGGPAYLFRVVEETPLVISPSQDDTVAAFPLLIWEAFSANFPFVYQAIVNDFDADVWSGPLLSPTLLSIEVSDSLPDGHYYWTISVLDSFRNSSRSKQGYFIVSQGETR
jgi:hypothetical protein